MRKTASLVLFLAWLAGCNTQAPAPLQVTDVFPPDGYHGFKKDEAIVIEFNRPVDPASFADAYRSDSEGLKPDQVTVIWSDGNTKVTVKPNQPLAYSPDDNYIYYSFEVGTELADRNGRHLAEPLRVTFSTLRTLTEEVLSVPELDGSGSGMQVVTNEPYLLVGDSTGDAGIRSFLAFPWPEEAEEILNATLVLVCVSGQGTPFNDLGALNIEPVDLGEGIQPDDIYNPALAPPIRDDGTGWTCQLDQQLRYDTTDLALAAWNENLARLDLRLRFDAASDGDGAADAVTFFAREAEATTGPGLLPALELTYYGP